VSGRTFTAEHQVTNIQHKFASQVSVDSIERTASYHEEANIAYEKNVERINIPDEQIISPIVSQRVVASVNNNSEPLPELEPEREVILRFEVAVGTTPLNLTFDDVSGVYEHNPIRNDVAIGTTPLNRTVDQERDHLP
jgi:hypothetical protein